MIESLDRVRGSAGVVAVLGCGNMGAAFVRALLASGRRVVVWNRTAERVQPLVGAGAEPRLHPDEAVSDAALVITCLGTTDDVRAVLGSIDDRQLAGRTLLNVTTGAAPDAHELSRWAHQRGLHYLDAAIAAYPEQIGTPDARIFVAGDERLWMTYRETVCALAGASMHVGTDPDAANVIDAALTGAFYITSLVSFVEAARFVRELGVSDDVLRELVGYSVRVLEHQMLLIVQRLADGSFATNEATLGVYADASEAFAAGMGSKGNACMIETTARVLRRAVNAGLGDLDLAALATLTRPSAD